MTWLATHAVTGDSFTMHAHELLRGLLSKTIVRVDGSTAQQGLWVIRKVGG